tara:strand:+ start:148 stop:543 length:396 start_codon:yes stop_codon:yes gene_type:complete
MKFSEIELPSNRKFGYFFSSIFLLAGIYFFIVNNHFLGNLFFILAFLFILVTSVNPKLLRPLNKLWMMIGFIIGKVVGPIVLAIIFFGLITPVGIVTRIFGRDELMLKHNTLKSHWNGRNESEAMSFKNQF